MKQTSWQWDRMHQIEAKFEQRGLAPAVSDYSKMGGGNKREGFEHS